MVGQFSTPIDIFSSQSHFKSDKIASTHFEIHNGDGMSKRHRYAIEVQHDGNIAAIAKSLFYYIDECMKEGIDPGTDPAIRLIVHHMNFLIPKA